MDLDLHKGGDRGEARWVGRLLPGRAARAYAQSAATKSLMPLASPVTKRPAPSVEQRWPGAEQWILDGLRRRLEELGPKSAQA